MPSGSIIKQTTLTSGQSIANAFTGSQFTLITEASVVSVGVVADATTVTFGLNIGNRIIVEGGTPVPLQTIANGMPVIPDSMYFTFPALPGEILQLSIQGPTGSTPTFRAVANIAAA